MFTGLIEECGQVVSITPTTGGARLCVAAAIVVEGLAIGDSVAVNGACLTVVELDAGEFSVECVAETLRRTGLGTLEAGHRVNLERALKADTRLGGHIVQGHVDGAGQICDARSEGDSVVLEIGVEAEHLRYIVEKGSIAVDGVSLTVAERLEDGFTVALIPHTIDETTLGADALGRRVNLELDVIAK